MQLTDAEIEAVADAIVARIMPMVTPIIRDAIDEVMGESVTVTRTSQVIDGVTTPTAVNTTIRTSQPFAGPLANFNDFLAKHGLPAATAVKERGNA